MIEDPSFFAIVGTWVGKERLVGLIIVYGPNVHKERTKVWGGVEKLVEKTEVKCFRGF